MPRGFSISDLLAADLSDSAAKNKPKRLGKSSSRNQKVLNEFLGFLRIVVEDNQTTAEFGTRPVHKVCPTCGEVYQNSSLNYCRKDGTALKSGPIASDALNTLVLPALPSRQPPATAFSVPNAKQRITSTSLPPRSRPDSNPIIESLAVLPLTNAYADPNGEYLSDGITETLINMVSQVPDLRVVPRSTVFRYKSLDVDPQECGRQLGVRAVLTGRVQQIGDTLTIQADLIDVVNEAQLWGQRYRRQMTDIFDLQEEIANEIFQKLRVRVTTEQQQRLRKRQTDNPAAYQAYLKGRYYWNKRTEEGLRTSTKYFQDAVDIDPCYAQAYAGLADSYAVQGIAEYGLTLPTEAMPRAKAAAAKALEIDDTLVEAQTTIAHVVAFMTGIGPELNTNSSVPSSSILSTLCVITGTRVTSRRSDDTPMRSPKRRMRNRSIRCRLSSIRISGQCFIMRASWTRASPSIKKPWSSNRLFLAPISTSGSRMFESECTRKRSQNIRRHLEFPMVVPC